MGNLVPRVLSPSHPSLTHFLWTSTTDKTLGIRLLIWESPVQTDATLLDVTCRVRLHTLLHVVGSRCAKFETGQAFSHVKTNSTTTNTVGPTMLGV